MPVPKRLAPNDGAAPGAPVGCPKRGIDCDAAKPPAPNAPVVPGGEVVLNIVDRNGFATPGAAPVI